MLAAPSLKANLLAFSCLEVGSAEFAVGRASMISTADAANASARDGFDPLFHELDAFLFRLAKASCFWSRRHPAMGLMKASFRTNSDAGKKGVCSEGLG